MHSDDGQTHLIAWLEVLTNLKNWDNDCEYEDNSLDVWSYKIGYDNKLGSQRKGKSDTN